MRILGLDIGSSSVKAVEMDSAFGRYDIHDYHEKSCTPGTPIEETILQLFAGLPKPPDRMITAIPTSHSTFRNLNLPTRDKKAIQSSVGFELEDELPFPIEDCAYDFAILNQTKSGSTIHVAATLKRHLVQLILGYQKSKIDPDVVTTEAWAYRTLMNRVLGTAAQEAPVLLAQIGHEKTTFYLHWRGAPALTREMSWGGKDLTQAISEKYSIPLDQAEAAKLDRGFVTAAEGPGEFTPEQVELAYCIESALMPLILELKQIELMSRNVTHHTLSTIYLGGGTALLPGLIGWIEGHVKTPTQALQALSSITPSGVRYSDQTDARFLLAASLALSQVGSDRSACVSFRKKEFAKEALSQKINLEILRGPLLSLGIVSFCLFLSLIVQSSVYKSQAKSVNTQIERSIKTFFGSLPDRSIRGYIANNNSLRSDINKKLSEQRELAKLLGPNIHSPIDFLNSLSATIPKDVVIDLTQFQAGLTSLDSFNGTDQNQQAKLTFVFGNPQTAEKLATTLNGKFNDLQRGKIEEVEGSDPNLKKWKLTFSGKPAEDSYAR